jgi:ABC-type glutathione transport system ATPase component
MAWTASSNRKGSKLPDTTALLNVEKMDVAFGTRRARKHVIDSVDLQVRAGEIVGLIGESGSGKTTIARAVLGLAHVARGKVYVAGEEVSGFSGSQWRDFRRRGVVQYVFQDPLRSLDPDVLIGDSISEPLRIRGGVSKDEIKAAVRAQAAEVRFDEELLDRYPAEISGGQRQRAAVARALITRPKLIILDEPVSALDAATRVQVLDMLLSLRSDSVGLLYISHDIGSVIGITDRTYVLYRGKVVEHGATRALAIAPEHVYTRLLIGSTPTLSGKALNGVQRRELRDELETLAV